jgi:hypothetical protein
MGAQWAGARSRALVRQAPACSLACWETNESLHIIARLQLNCMGYMRYEWLVEGLRRGRNVCVRLTASYALVEATWAARQ